MLRIILTLFFLQVCLLTPAHAQSQGKEAVFAEALAYAVKNFSKQKWDWARGGFKYTNWCARYADGTQVYNEYRSYRTPETIMGYLSGTHTASWKTWEGRTYYYRGSAEAKGHVRRHGKIVQLSYYERGRWTPVL